jgi:hypothetical protein
MPNSNNKNIYDYLKSLIAKSSDNISIPSTVTVFGVEFNAPRGGNRGNETKKAIEKYGLPPQEGGNIPLKIFNTPFPLFYSGDYIKNEQNCTNLLTQKKELRKLSSLKWDYSEKKWIDPSTNVKYTSPVDNKIVQFKVHEKEKNSIENAYKQILSSYGIEQIYKLGLNTCSGTYNPRNQRNGSNYSTHSWGIAIDILAGLNPNNSTLNAPFRKPEYKTFLDIMEANGWYSGGRAWNRDYMHFQTIKL